MQTWQAFATYPVTISYCPSHWSLRGLLAMLKPKRVKATTHYQQVPVQSEALSTKQAEMSADSDFAPVERKAKEKVVDTRLPLVWLIGAAASVMGSYFVLHGDVGRLRSDVAELKIDVKAKDSATTALQGQMAILQYRVDTTEAELKRIKDKTGVRE